MTSSIASPTPATLLVLLLVGCGGAQRAEDTRDEQPTTDPIVAEDPPREEAPTCPPELANLESTLRSLDGVPLSDASTLPVASRAPAITAGTVLQVFTNTLTLDGRLVTQGELAQRLTELRGPRILVAAAADVPVTTLATVLGRIPTSWHIDLLTRSAPAEGAGPDCASMRAAIEQAAGACEDARTASRGFVGCAEEDAPMLRSGSQPSLVEALESCGCGGADLDAIAAIATRAHDRSHASRGYSLDDPSGGRMNLRALRLPRTATVQDLVARLDAPPAAE